MAFITNTDTTILPYNDEDMKYELNLGQYVLTKTGFKKFTGIDIEEYVDTPSEGDFFFLEQSDDVYGYLNSISLVTSIPLKKYYIAKNPDIREEFKRVLAYQCRYATRSGANLLKDQHGINIEKGKGIDVRQLRGRLMISPQSENKLYELGLLYAGFEVNFDFLDDGTW